MSFEALLLHFVPEALVELPLPIGVAIAHVAADAAHFDWVCPQALADVHERAVMAAASVARI